MISLPPPIFTSSLLGRIRRREILRLCCLLLLFLLLLLLLLLLFKHNFMSTTLPDPCTCQDPEACYGRKHPPRQSHNTVVQSNTKQKSRDRWSCCPRSRPNALSNAMDGAQDARMWRAVIYQYHR